MPRILELKQIDGAFWARIPIESMESPIHVYSEEETKQLKRSAVRSFCNELAEDWINRNCPYPTETQDD